MNDEIKQKTYREIISELEILDLLRMLVLGLATTQLLVLYIFIRINGFNSFIKILYLITIGYFIIPLIIELIIKKSNKYIS